MKSNNGIQSIYSRLKRFTPFRLLNTPHKNALRRILEKEPIQQTPMSKKPAAWLKLALPAFAACLVIIIFNLVVILPVFFSQPDLARLYRTYDEGALQENAYVFDKNRGRPLTIGTVYKTSGSETHLIIFKDRTTVQIFTDTEFRLTELSETGTCLLASLYLRHGILEYNSQNTARPPCFSVITDSASIEIIGTRFKVQVARDNALHVEVSHGQVRINHLHGSLETIKKASLAEEERHYLEALLSKTAITLSRGQMYITYYDEIQQFQESIHSLIQTYLNRTNQKDKKADLKEIENKVELLHSTLQKLILTAEGKSTPSASLKEDGTESAQDTGVSTPRESTPSSSSHYVLSTLEANDTHKKLWSSSGPKDFFTISSEHTFSGSYALKIALAEPVSEIFAWYLTLTDKLPLNKKLTLKVHIKTQELQGQGIALAVRADGTPFPEDHILLYNTTRDQLIITSRSDWQEYTLPLTDIIPPSTKSISLYLLCLPRTTGSVYFDDIRLEFD